MLKLFTGFLKDKGHRPTNVDSVEAVRQAVLNFERSGLFQRDWYLRTYPDVAAANVDPMAHYLEVGWREGRKPHPFFDAKWYLSKNPDAAASGMSPLLHYWRFGERENRQPCPLFETAWYRATYHAPIGAGSPLGHYLAHRHLKRFSPNRFFDVVYYLDRNPDVAAAGVDPLEHFVSTGFREGRWPSEAFDVSYYVRKYLQGDARDPLTHYFDVGAAQGCLPSAPREEQSAANEIRKFTRKGADFEEFNPYIVGAHKPRAKVIAFYLPQFHAFPENDTWWGKGFTEWTNIGRGTPRFVGHYQPRVPRDFGFYDLSNPEVMPRQVDAAKAAGIHGFCFYYYNFNGKRLLDKPVEQFLANRSIDFPFCLLWANENWTRRWDGSEREILIRQDYRETDAPALIDDFARHFKDPRYIRIDGRPLLLLYRADVVPDVSVTLAHWRQLFETRHGVRPLIFMAQTFNNNDPRELGFDGAFEFPPHKITASLPVANGECQPLDDTFTAQVYKYDDIVAAAAAERPPHFPLVRTVFPSWDNDARRQGQGLTVIGSSPKSYERWLSNSIAFARNNPVQGENLVFVNAWNEWAEGAYLEPDLHFGSAYLNATARSVVGQANTRRRVLLVGHDAFPAGAQMILLNIAKALKNFAVEVEVLLCAGGDLAVAYEAVCPTTVAVDPAERKARIAKLAERGFSHAITNTTAAGVAVDALKDHGFQVLALVHELPRIVSEKGLASAARTIAELADTVVFPAAVVRDQFLSEVATVANATMVRPQGLYQKLQTIPDAKSRLAEEFGFPADARLVVNVGYGDLRKGVDLFCVASQLVAAKRDDTIFVWVGKLDESCAAWLQDAAAFPNVRFAGHRTDIDLFLSAADVFALTSREDPYPSVALEATSLSVPLIAFEAAGGISEMMRENGLGRIVPYGNVAALSEAICEVLGDGGVEQALRRKAKAYSSTSLEYDSYAFDLLHVLDPTVRRISVIVPNFNYARYLAERLNSVFDQGSPVFEVIVLDDASTDDSLAVLDGLSMATRREFKVIPNAANSGSVFAQWARGLAAARGDLVWIAEADDIAETDFLSRLVPSFADEETLFAFCDSKAIDENGNALPVSYKEYYSQVEPGALSHDLVLDSKEFATRFLAQRNLILNASAVVWRRDVLEKALASVRTELGSVKLIGDWLLYLAACGQGGKVAYCAEQKNRHRRHDGGVTLGMSLAKQVKEIGFGHDVVNRLFGEDPERSRAQEAYRAYLSARAEEPEEAETEAKPVKTASSL